MRIKLADQNAQTIPANSGPAITETPPTDMEIIEEVKHQSTVVSSVTQIKPLDVQAQLFTPKGKNKRVSYADIVSGSGSDDSWPTSPSPMIVEVQTQKFTSEKSRSTAKDKPQQPKTKKKSKLTPTKNISTVMSLYMKPKLKFEKINK